ncbi:MAG: MFS transporter [Candidatus Gottesmanbacteria bacterium]|nr:MFS transporter [Candidatus Gottesmanbacteria bacterium]
MARLSKKNISSNVFFIGLLSFFGGISQDIFVPVLPLYLANVLHFDKAFIGLTEGLVTSSASVFKIVAGYLSDKLRKNKPIVFAGYFLSFVSRPLLALTTSGMGVLGLRFLDGVGKGIKDAPKDALIAESTQVASRGKGFGIVRALDTLGSVAGPLLLFALLYVLQNNTLKYHYIFFVTAIPLIFTLSILSFFVKEAPVKKTESLFTKSPLPKRYFLFLGIVLLFSLGNSSDTFLILRSQNLGVSLLGIPLVYALFNFVYATASIPLGSLSDKIGREKVILMGWFFYALSYLGFAMANKSYQAWLLFALYGIYYATTEGVVKAYIADQVASGHRGKAYGIYNSLVGLVTLPASFITGLLWDKISPAAPFYFSAAVALFAGLLLLIYTRVIKYAPLAGR